MRQQERHTRVHLCMLIQEDTYSDEGAFSMNMPTTEDAPKADTGFSIPGMPTNFGFGGIVCVRVCACERVCVRTRRRPFLRLYSGMPITITPCCAGGDTQKQNSGCAQQ